MSISNWQCPYCNEHCNISSSNHSTDEAICGLESKDGHKKLCSEFIMCPNIRCRRLTMNISIQSGSYGYSTGWRRRSTDNRIRIMPESLAKVFPDYIPEAIIEDYGEACKIKNLSPKASATLARRCLQGMIRDFWAIKKSNLKQAIDALEDAVEPDVWDAVNAVREIGNIGAHMEKDINLIIDVDEEEADQLIWLIEYLLDEWYIRRYRRQQKLNEIKKTAEEKKEARKKTTSGDSETEQTEQVEQV